MYGNYLSCNQRQVLPGTAICLPQPSRLVWTAGGGEVTLPLLQPHSKGITFTEDTHFQIRIYAATSTLPQARTSKHSCPKGLCPVTVPLCSSAYTCALSRDASCIDNTAVPTTQPCFLLAPLPFLRVLPLQCPCNP